MQKHEEWLFIAEDDLRGAKKLIAGDDPVISPAIFHTQQCAEKALKAYLAYKKQPPKRVHDLVMLLVNCMEFDKSFETLSDDALELNPYLSESRYPDDAFVIPDLTTVKNAIKIELTKYSLS